MKLTRFTRLLTVGAVAIASAGVAVLSVATPASASSPQCGAPAAAKYIGYRTDGHDAQPAGYTAALATLTTHRPVYCTSDGSSANYVRAFVQLHGHTAPNGSTGGYLQVGFTLYANSPNCAFLYSRGQIADTALGEYESTANYTGTTCYPVSSTTTVAKQFLVKYESPCVQGPSGQGACLDAYYLGGPGGTTWISLGYVANVYNSGRVLLPIDADQDVRVGYPDGTDIPGVSYNTGSVFSASTIAGYAYPNVPGARVPICSVSIGNPYTSFDDFSGPNDTYDQGNSCAGSSTWTVFQP